MSSDKLIQTEILRKLIHLSSMWIPLLYLWTDKTLMAIVVGLIASIYIFMDYYRHRNLHITKLFSYFSYVLRDFEKSPGKLTGASHLLISSFILILFFSKLIAVISLSVLVIADTMAAIVGVLFGKNHFWGKTLEGSLAFFFSGLVTGYIILATLHESNLNLISLIIAMLIATVTESVSTKFKIDDNFSVPLSIALSLLIIEKVA